MYTCRYLLTSNKLTVCLIFKTEGIFQYFVWFYFQTRVFLIVLSDQRMVMMMLTQPLGPTIMTSRKNIEMDRIMMVTDDTKMLTIGECRFWIIFRPAFLVSGWERKNQVIYEWNSGGRYDIKIKYTFESQSHQKCHNLCMREGGNYIERKLSEKILEDSLHLLGNLCRLPHRDFLAAAKFSPLIFFYCRCITQLKWFLIKLKN